jgi:phospholipid-binding lipoprotein MlaA
MSKRIFVPMRGLRYLPLLALLSGCATTGPKTPGDPYEGFNRKMWKFDESLDKSVMKPVAKGYIAVMPHPVRNGLSNMLSNVTEPFNFINAVLQAKPHRALRTFGRFMINTTLGIGGFMDVAGKEGIKQAPEDLGQTFAVWGVKKSPYLVLPLWGPTTLRDGAGTVASAWVDPYRIVVRKELDFWPAFGLTAFEFVDARANLIDSGADTLLETSADTYAVTRSAYLQRRQALIEDRDGDSAQGDDAALNAALDDLGPGDGSGAAPAPATPPTLSPDQPTAKPEPQSPPQDQPQPGTPQ